MARRDHVRNGAPSGHEYLQPGRAACRRGRRHQRDGRGDRPSGTRLGAEVVSAGRHALAERKPADGVREVIVDTTDESLRARTLRVGRRTGSSARHRIARPVRQAPRPGPRAGAELHGWQVLRKLDVCPLCRPTPAISRVHHFRHRRFRGPPSRWRVDDHGGICCRRRLDAGARRRTRTAPGERDSALLHRHRVLELSHRSGAGGLSAARRRDGAGTTRAGAPQDVAQGAIFLMTNPQMTGTILEITGGDTLVNNVD